MGCMAWCMSEQNWTASLARRGYDTGLAMDQRRRDRSVRRQRDRILEQTRSDLLVPDFNIFGLSPLPVNLDSHLFL